MVTQDRTERLPWDSFLEREVSRDVRANPNALETARKMIEGFRVVEWPNIRRDLGQPPYNWDVPDSLEPHWVSPGHAIYWQELIIREPVEKSEGDRTFRVLEDVSKGWYPTDTGLPANNPSVISHYLNKGFRLRPPSDVAVETLEATVPSEALALMDAPEEPAKAEYLCRRHHYQRKTFTTWKGYARHCANSLEPLEYDPPVDILNLMQSFPFVCMIHGRGFMNSRTAGMHAKAELRKPGNKHPNLEQMKVNKDV